MLRQIAQHVLPPREVASTSASSAPSNIADLRTPALVVRLPVARANASRMLGHAQRLGCRLRPHVKTHKTLELGKLQTNGSCRCITVSTLAEAEFFAAGGFDDIVCE